MNLEQGQFLRFTIFIASVTVLIGLEFLFPRRDRKLGRQTRWTPNFLYTGLNTLIMRVLLPSGLAGIAMYIQKEQWGLISKISIHPAIEFFAGLIFFDLLIYWQHRLFHKLPWLWRIHKMHHSDPELDISSSARFHPIEILLSAGIKMAFLATLGINPIYFIIFEIILSTSSNFHHSNLYLPPWLDSTLSKLIVTPDYHRIHHSQIPKQTQSHFSFFLVIWDHLFKSRQYISFNDNSKIKIGQADITPPQATSPLKTFISPWK